MLRVHQLRERLQSPHRAPWGFRSKHGGCAGAGDVEGVGFVDAVGKRGGGVGDCDFEGFERRGRCEVEGGGDEEAVVLGEDLTEVAVDGGGEVAVARGGDGEFGGKRDRLWVGPAESGGLGPYVDWISNG